MDTKEQELIEARVAADSEWGEASREMDEAYRKWEKAGRKNEEAYHKWGEARRKLQEYQKSKAR